MNSRYQDKRAQALRLYADADGVPRCACCREDHHEFLGIYRQDGTNSPPRGRSGNLYERIVADGRRRDHAVLCQNCRHAVHRNGSCPHQTGATALRHPPVAKPQVAVQTPVGVQGAGEKRRWTAGEEDILRIHYPTEGRSVMYRLPGRSAHSVKQHAAALGVVYADYRGKRVRNP